MKYALLGGVFLFFWWSILTPSISVLNFPRLSVIEVQAQEPDYSTTTLQKYAIEVAKENNLNISHFIATISCESGFIWNATSTTSDFGIVQINTWAHPDITKDEMFDPYWSLSWMAKEWIENREHEWVCYNHLFGTGSG